MSDGAVTLTSVEMMVAAFIGGRRHIGAMQTGKPDAHGLNSETADGWGWIRARDAKRPEWIREHSNRPAAYFVPQAALRPMEDEGWRQHGW